MKNNNLRAISLALALVLVTAPLAYPFGRGGRVGGGGGFSGGARPGGGMPARPAGGMGGNMGARPMGGMGSAPSMNRMPQNIPRPSTPAAGGSRPNPGMNNRPNIGGGNANLGGATRPPQPNLRPTPSNNNNRPATRPGDLNNANRPNAGNRPSTLPGLGGSGTAGSGQRPANPDRPNIGGANRPNAGNLPGLGGDAGNWFGNNSSAISDRVANRPMTPQQRRSELSQAVENRPANLDQRRNDLSNRLSDANREDWQQNRNDFQDKRQDFRDNHREDWQQFADDHIHNHGDWYNDCWHPDGDWEFGDGWSYMWDNYPALTAFGVTRWGVNRYAYGFGYWNYYNPYAVGTPVYDTYNYSQPIVNYSEPAAESSTAAATDTAGSAETSAIKQALDESRAAFIKGDYSIALRAADRALKSNPKDTAVHEYRGLILFAMGRFQESAATVYAVLAAGPGWDWTTMSGFYPDSKTYTDQLRRLEKYVEDNPKTSDGNFLLGYHYLTMDYKQQASESFQAALKLTPNDKLIQQLVALTTPPDPNAAKPTAPASDVPADKVIDTQKLTGSWSAKSGDSTFQLKLTADGVFGWTFSQGGKSQTVSGVYACDKNNLVMNPDAGGNMVAIINLESPTQFQFLMVGGDPKDPGLEFTKL
jgi:tetratricopeptide (TPR) repeat protein